MDGYGNLDSGDSYINNDVYSELIEQQSESTRESIKFSNEMIKSYQKMIDKFEGVDSVSDTWKTIKKLNEEIDKLKDSTKSLNKTISDNNEIIKRTPQDIKERKILSDEEMKTMPARHRKRRTEDDDNARKADSTFKDSANKALNSNDELLSKVNDKLTASSFKMKKFENEYNELIKPKNQEPKQSETNNDTRKPDNKIKVVGNEVPTTKIVNDDGNGGQEEEKKKDDRFKKFGLFFVKASTKATTTTFKAVMSPITMLLKGMSGMLSGIWNSSLMGIAKVVAMVGVLVLAFDWIKVSIAGWRKEMMTNYQDFMSKNNVWGKAMSDLVLLGEAIKSFLNPNFESELLKKTESGWTSIAKNMGNSIMSILSAGMTELFNQLTRLINNALPLTTKYNDQQWYSKVVESNGDIKNEDINEANYQNETLYRTQKREESMLGLMGHISKDSRTHETWEEINENNSRSTRNGIRTQISKIVSAETGMSLVDAYKYFDENPELMNNYLKEAFDNLETLKENGYDIHGGKFTSITEKTGDKGYKSTKEDKYLSYIMGISNVVRENTPVSGKGGIKNVILNELNKNVEAGNGLYNPEFSERWRLKKDGVSSQAFGGLPSWKDVNGFNQSQILSDNNSSYIISNKLDALISVMTNKEGESLSANISQVVQNNNTYTGQTPTGGLPSYGTMNNIRNGGD